MICFQSNSFELEYSREFESIQWTLNRIYIMKMMNCVDFTASPTSLYFNPTYRVGIQCIQRLRIANYVSLYSLGSSLLSHDGNDRIDTD